MALTETDIRKLPKRPEKEILIGDGRCLYLRCYPSGRQSWLFRTRVGGSWRTRNLGEYPSVSLAEARVKSAALSGKKLPASVTFGQLLDEWYSRKIEPSYKITKNIEVYINRGKEKAGNHKLSGLTTKHLMDILKDYADSAPVSANRCLSNWKLALNYAVECGYIDNNPLGRTTARAVGGKESTRERTLTNDEIIATWKDLHPHSPILKFLLLTGLRISEAQTAEHKHLDGNRLNIPDNKSSRPHWVHLPQLALDLIGDHNGYFFEQRSSTAIQSRLKRNKSGWKPHDLRRTFTTRLAGLGVAAHVVEKMLNHTLGGVMAIYNRHDYETERIDATESWAQAIKYIVKSSAET